MTLQFLTQRPLPVGKAAFQIARCAALTLLLALSLTLLAILAVLLALTLAAVLALVLLRLAGLLAFAVELFLKVAECLVRKPLLFAQRFGQTLHRLLARALLTGTTLGDLHVLHHLAQLIQKLLRLGHAALFHKFL